MSTPTQAAKAGHTPEIKPIPLSQVDAQMEFYKRAVDERDRLREALTDLEKALRTDSRQKDIASDTVEYHLDGQAMYQAINKARAALKEGK